MILLVTGASGGIGQIIFKTFASRVKNIISSSRKISSGVTYYNKFDNYTHIQGNLTKEKDVRKLVREIEDKYGRLDILINSIGGSLYSHRIEDFPLNDDLPPGIRIQVKKTKERCGRCNNPFIQEVYIEPSKPQEKHFRVFCEKCNYVVPIEEELY